MTTLQHHRIVLFSARRLRQFSFLTFTIQSTVPSPIHSPRQQRQQQHWQGWNQFGITGVFLSVPRYDWSAPLSQSSSCMLVNHGPSQQSSKEEYKPWKWGAAPKYYASHTKTMLPTRKSVPRSSRAVYELNKSSALLLTHVKISIT